MLPPTVRAQDYNYTTNNGTITITKYTGPGGAVTISGTLNGLPVTSVGEYAFEQSSLTSVTIPNGITSIGNYAFYSCVSLTNVTIPQSVTNLGLFAFLACTRLTAITVDALSSAYGSVDGILFNKSQTTLIQYPGGKAGSYSIPNSVTNIGSAFFYCSSLTGVTIPNSVTSIGGSAFSYCTSLASVTIPNSVTSIGGSAFSYCTSLGNVTIPGSITSIGGSAFSSCSNLTSVTIPSSVISIGGSAFSYCTSLTGITIPKSVTSIGSGAFSSCTSLTAITVDSLNSAYSSMDGVLFNKTQTTLIQCPGGKAGTYTIPNSVTSIGNGVFQFCARLTSVTIPNSVTNLGVLPFRYCTSLVAITVDSLNSAYSSVEGVLFNKTQTTLIQCPGGKAGTYTIPNSVTSIGSEAFANCASLASVTIGNSATSVGYGAFQNCTSLASVMIGNSVTNSGDQAFINCTNLTAITVGALNSVYGSVDGVLFNISQTTLIQCPGGKAGSYTIPNSVTSIGGWAFAYCTRLTSVTIPNNLTNIGGAAFYSSTSLTSVTIGSGVTTIGDTAFANCTSLTRVNFQGNAPSVGGFVFYGGNDAIIYYLPGTTGWGTTLDGRPAALWKPQVRTSDASFGVRTNQFGFTIAWASGMAIVVEASTNLANPTWFPVETNTFSGDSFYFRDPNWTNYSARFYRIRSP